MNLQDQIKKYERFISHTLEPKLQELEEERSRYITTAESCGELVVLLENHQRSEESALNALVDIGGRCILSAIIPDPSKLLVDTGVGGFFVEMSMSEAVVFVKARRLLLERKLILSASKIELTEADLKQANELLGQLKNIAEES